jgi:hypothetical protein
MSYNIAHLSNAGVFTLHAIIRNARLVWKIVDNNTFVDFN